MVSASSAKTILQDVHRNEYRPHLSVEMSNYCMLINMQWASVAHVVSGEINQESLTSIVA